MATLIIIFTTIPTFIYIVLVNGPTSRHNVVIATIVKLFYYGYV